MRALYLVLLVTLCLPLQAGDPADLNRAVEMFRSPHPAVRAEGSKLADKELRQLLAPLLKAMKDPDPEVRRRVREAVLGLVPDHGREPQKAPLGVNVKQFVKVGWQFKFPNQPNLVPRVQVIPRIRMPKAQRFGLHFFQPIGANAMALVARLGLVGNFIAVPKRGIGFRVMAVTPNSAAAKAGLIAGDTILTINKQPVNSWANFLKAIGKKRSFSGSTLKGLRGNGNLAIVVK